MPGQTIQAVRRYYSQRFPRYIRFVKVTPDAKKVLSKLKKEGYLLGCVTNSHRDITRQMIQKTGIKKYFKVIVCADEVKKPKPAPDMLFKAMRRLKVKPDEVIFIGDTPTDLMAGIRAKCLTFGYKINAKYQIKSLKELLDQYNFFT